MEDRDARAALNQQGQQIHSLAKAIQQAATKKARDEAEARRREIIETMTAVQSKLIDRSAAYTNLMLLGGYAGFFGLWSGMRSSLPLKVNVLTVLAAGFSLLIFISYEVFKMAMMSVQLLKSRRVLTEQGSAEAFFRRLKELQEAESRSAAGSMWLWIITVFLSITTILFAVGLLAYNFIAMLVAWPLWPT